MRVVDEVALLERLEGLAVKDIGMIFDDRLQVIFTNGVELNVEAGRGSTKLRVWTVS